MLRTKIKAKLTESKLRNIRDYVIKESALIMENKKEVIGMEAELEGFTLSDEALEKVSYEERIAFLTGRRKRIVAIESKWRIIHYQEKQLVKRLEKFLSIGTSLYAQLTDEEKKLPWVQGIWNHKHEYENGLGKLKRGV